MVLVPSAREGGEDHGHAGADVGRLDRAALEGRGPGDHGAVRIAEDDPGAHADELVDEEQPRLEHLLEDEEHALALRGGDDGGGHGIGGERRPGAILELGDVPAEVGADAPLLVGVDVQGVAVEARANAEPLEAQQGGAEVVAPDALDGDVAVGDGGEADEAADLDVVGADRVSRAGERAAALDGVDVGADALDLAPRALRKRARSCTWGSAAALRRTVRPLAATAAMRAFSVPVTLGSSRKMSVPMSALASTV